MFDLGFMLTEIGTITFLINSYLLIHAGYLHFEALFTEANEMFDAHRPLDRSLLKKHLIKIIELHRTLLRLSIVKYILLTLIFIYIMFNFISKTKATNILKCEFGHPYK